jgi:hypothetical protein
MKALLLLAFLATLVVASQAYKPDWAECDKTKKYEFTPTDIVLNDPPWIGHSIQVNVSGKLADKDVDSGTAEIKVTFMGVPVFDKQTQMSDWGKLPFLQGDLDLSYAIPIPSVAPKGAYVVNLDFHDQDSDEFNCVNVNLNLS